MGHILRKINSIILCGHALGQTDIWPTWLISSERLWNEEEGMDE